MLLQRLFGRRKTQRSDPGIRWGRYSDNNKSSDKVTRWGEAERFFREGKFEESLDAFFDYLDDEQEGNVTFKREGKKGTFVLHQGSKIVRGEFDEEHLGAEVIVAAMPDVITPVMRRLLEMNFNLYYSRYSLHEGTIRMRFDTDLATADPNKLYYGLRELAIKADKQDDLLVTEFGALQPADVDHIVQLPDTEKQIKLEFYHSWLDKTLNYVLTLDAEKFVGAIAHMLLNVVFQIDFLLAPEGKLMQEIERIPDKYYKKEGKPSAERNQEMIDALQRMRNRSKEEIYPYLFNTKHTFSIVSPQNHKQVSDTIHSALQTMHWYKDNNYPLIANNIMEYSLAYCQYSFSLPRPITELYELFLEVNHGDFFAAFGHAPQLYNHETNRFEEELIVEIAEDINAQWRSRYPKFRLETRDLNFANLVKFNQSFLNAVAAVNMDT